jgi:hypothetical protein
MTPQSEMCFVCGVTFWKKKRHQKFCSRECYKKSWPILNREKHNARQLKKRHDNPAWFREHEPKYYRTYRRKKLTKRPWAYLLQSAKLRAKEKRWIFDLTDEWASARWTDCCEVSKLPFEGGKKGRGPHPLSPTIDRIDSSIGYTQENTRFVLWGVNALRGLGDDAEMYRIAEAIVKNKTK